MNVTIFSGGSGNTQILNALYKVDPYAKVNIIVNAYDNGKSTGICRKITNTLGVSDIRKNQYKIRKMIRGNAERDGIDIFMEDRFDLADWPYTRLDVIDRVKSLTNTSVFDKYINDFFDLVDMHVDYKRIQFKSFNLSNIVYASMFRSLGYKETIDFFNKFLGIDTDRFNVIVNSYENVFIGADTDDGTVLEDEADIVEFASNENKIKSIILSGDVKFDSTQESILAVKESDLIVISTGTFWSSIQPTFLYSHELNKAVNESNAKKLWFMNTLEDKDSYNVSVSEFINYMEKIGLDVNKFRIVENERAIETLRSQVEGYDVETFDFGNNKGKHEVPKLVEYFKEKIYEFFNVKNIYIDFDDTLYSRSDIRPDKLISEDNLKCLDKLAKTKKVTIISGNTTTHVFSKANATENINFIINSNAMCFDENKKFVRDISSFKIDTPESIKNVVLSEFPELKDKIESTPYCIKIKPVSDRENKIAKINALISGTKARAYKRGRTTIDILNINNNKENALKELCLPTENSLYIGDEIYENGNDSEIAKFVNNSIHINSVYEMNILLDYILQKMC